MINFACIAPHPPIIIPSVGKENLNKVKKTIQSMKELNKKFVQSKSKNLIIISPHAFQLSGSFALARAIRFSGDLSMFGDFHTMLSFEPDKKLSDKITSYIRKTKITLSTIENNILDHGCLVPLYYLTKNISDIKLTVLSFTDFDLSIHFKFGQALFEALKDEKERISICASGDLSHRLTPKAPAGFHPDGKKFDENLVSLLKKKNISSILSLNPKFIENAGECGLRSIVILLGFLDKLNYNIKILSYEGPFGVGYLVANFEILSK